MSTENRSASGKIIYTNKKLGKSKHPYIASVDLIACGGLHGLGNPEWSAGRIEK